MDYINDIRKRMEEAGADYVDFFYHRNKPIIQKDGIRYEVLSISAPEEGDTNIHLLTIPSYGFMIKDIYVDATWRITTWRKLYTLVDAEVKRLYEI